MTPAEQAFNSQVKADITVCEIIENHESLSVNQEKIMEMILDEKEQNKLDFAKGTEKFNQLFKEVGEMKREIKDGFNSLKEEIKDKRINDLTEAVKEQKNDAAYKKSRVDKLKDGVLLFISVSIIGGLVGYFLDIKIG